ncbi:MAG: AzlC family ABC transporter permease [Actinomycetota bacterium]
MSDFSFDRRAFWSGFRDVIPLAVPGMPFGFVLGVVIADSGLDQFAAWMSSPIIAAGAAQLAAIELLAEQASAAVVLVTVAFINSRHLMYSAALRPRFAGFPGWFRAVGPYVLLDQSFALAVAQPDDIDDRTRMWHFFGSGAFLWTMWMIATALGVLVGDVTEPEWQLGFAVPILFGGLMILSIANRAGFVAAAVGAIVSVAGASLPQGSGVLLAIVLGVTAGGVVDSRTADAAEEATP